MQQQDRRIVCPDCGCPHVPVVYARPGWGDDSAVRRRRECRHCGKRFTTVEKAIESGTLTGAGDGRQNTVSVQPAKQSRADAPGPARRKKGLRHVRAKP